MVIGKKSNWVNSKKQQELLLTCWEKIWEGSRSACNVASSSPKSMWMNGMKTIFMTREDKPSFKWPCTWPLEFWNPERSPRATNLGTFLKP